MKKVFFVFVMFLALGSWAQVSVDTLSEEPRKIKRFTITTWEGEDLNFVIFDGYFWVMDQNDHFKKLESFTPKEIATPVIIAKPPYGRYDADCSDNEAYLICIYWTKDGDIWQSYFDIKTKKIVSVSTY